MRIIGPKFTLAECEIALSEMRSCMGIKWRHMGRQGLPWGHNVGLDCIGLLMRGVVAAGRPVQDTVYGPDPNGTLLGLIDEHLGPRTGAVPYSLVAIKFGSVKAPARHIAFLTDVNTLIHCYDGGPRCVVEHEFDSTWQNRIVSGWAL